MAINNRALAQEQLGKGMEYHRDGHLGLARSHYQRALKLDPGNADILHLLGVAALQIGSLPLAAKHFQMCIEISPRHAEAHNNLGVVLRRLDRHHEALASFRNALAARERYVEAAYNLGLTLEALGDGANAEQAYRTALAWRANYVDAAINLGNLLRREGRTQEALTALELAQRLAPERAQTSGNLALLLLDLGRYAEAVRYAHAAIMLEPQAPHWWRALGIAQRLRHDVENAIVSLRRVLELAPEDSTAQIELGLALQGTGAVDEARAVYAQTRAPAGYACKKCEILHLCIPMVCQKLQVCQCERPLIWRRWAQGQPRTRAAVQRAVRRVQRGP